MSDQLPRVVSPAAIAVGLAGMNCGSTLPCSYDRPMTFPCWF